MFVVVVVGITGIPRRYDGFIFLVSVFGFLDFFFVCVFVDSRRRYFIISQTHRVGEFVESHTRTSAREN